MSLPMFKKIEVQKVAYLSTVSPVGLGTCTHPQEVPVQSLSAEVPVAGPAGQAGMVGW